MSGVRFPFVAILGLVVALLAGSPVRAESPAMSDGQKTAIQKLVHDYLIEHPEVVVEALTVAQNNERRKSLEESHASLFNDPQAPVLGNPKGDVTVVEFFDYACPYCKSMEETLRSLLKEDSNVRLVLKEFPVLGQGSVLASRAALASREQDKYPAFHDALIATRGQFNEGIIMNIAHSVGLDTDRLKADMAKPEVVAAIKSNHELAETLSIGGTPAFVVGDQIYPGAMDLAALKQAVAQARKN